MALHAIIKNNFKCTTKNLESLKVLSILVLEKSREFSFVLNFNSPSYTFGQILCQLKVLLALLETTIRTIICGDFNFYACTSTKNYLQLKYVMDNYGFTNVNLNRTHKLGSCLEKDLRNSVYHCMCSISNKLYTQTITVFCCSYKDYSFHFLVNS